MYLITSMSNGATNVKALITMHRIVLLIITPVVTVPEGTHQMIALSKDYLLLNAATIVKIPLLTLRRLATLLSTETVPHTGQRRRSRRAKSPTTSQKTRCIPPDKLDCYQSV